MPRYDYKCTDESCGWEGELLAKLAERDNQTCPKEKDDKSTCGAQLTRDEISVTAEMPLSWSV